MLKMFRYFGFLCFAYLLHTSVTLEGKSVSKKPEPVELVYECIDETSRNSNKEDDAPVILLHGLSSTRKTWSGIDKEIAQETKRKVCGVDLRNFGDSPWSNETGTAAMTEDVSLLLRNMNVSQAILLGHSMGGKIAVHFALNYPEKVHKLIVEDFRVNNHTTEIVEDSLMYLKLLKSSLSAIPEGANETTAKQAAAGFIKKELGKTNKTTSIDEDSLQSLPITCSNGECHLTTNPDTVDQLLDDINLLLVKSTGRFDGPTLFIYGTDSTIKVAEDKNSIREIFPKVKFEPVEGASHKVHSDPEFIDEVVRFINA